MRRELVIIAVLTILLNDCIITNPPAALTTTEGEQPGLLQEEMARSPRRKSRDLSLDNWCDSVDMMVIRDQCICTKTNLVPIYNLGKDRIGAYNVQWEMGCRDGCIIHSSCIAAVYKPEASRCTLLRRFQGLTEGKNARSYLLLASSGCTGGEKVSLVKLPPYLPDIIMPFTFNASFGNGTGGRDFPPEAHMTDSSCSHGTKRFISGNCVCVEIASSISVGNHERKAIIAHSGEHCAQLCYFLPQDCIAALYIETACHIISNHIMLIPGEKINIYVPLTNNSCWSDDGTSGSPTTAKTIAETLKSTGPSIAVTTTNEVIASATTNEAIASTKGTTEGSPTTAKTIAETLKSTGPSIAVTTTNEVIATATTNEAIASTKGTTEDLSNVDMYFNIDSLTEGQKGALQEQLGGSNINDNGSEVVVNAQIEDSMTSIIASRLQSMDYESLKNLFLTSEEMFRHCSFAGEDCWYDRVFNPLLSPQYGICYTFNQNAENTVSRPGRLYGLKLIIDINSESYLLSSKVSGIKMMVHDHADYPFVDVFGFGLPAQMEVTVGLSVSDVFALSRPTQPCLREPLDDYNFYNESIYSYEGCQRSYIQLAIIQQCKCTHPLYALPPHGPRPPVCPRNNSCYTHHPLLRYTDLDSSPCKFPCRLTRFQISTSFAYLRDRKFGANLTTTRYDDIIVEVYYEHMFTTVMKEKLLIEVVDIFWILAGMMGFGLGLSAFDSFIALTYIIQQLVWLPYTVRHGVASLLRTPTENQQRSYVEYE